MRTFFSTRRCYDPGSESTWNPLCWRSAACGPGSEHDER